MASIKENKNKKKKTYRIVFTLYNHPTIKRWQCYKTFNLKKDADNILPLFGVISNKSKSNTASPQEVNSWIESDYLKVEDACIAFPLYGESRKVLGIGNVEIDWERIGEHYSAAKLRIASNKDPLSETHKIKMNLFKRIAKWVKENYPDLNITVNDVNAWLDNQRTIGKKANTRKQNLLALQFIIKSAVELGMKTENPIEHMTVRVASRPKYIPRVLIPADIAKAILNLPLETITEEQDFDRKRDRISHPLCSVSLKRLEKLPSVIDRNQALDVLGVHYSSLKRYISQGLLPQPSKAKSGRSGWAMNTNDLTIHIKKLIAEKKVKVQVRTIEPKHQTMRGAFPLAFRLGLWCGLRNGEVVWLPWEHVDLSKRLLHVKKVVSPNGITWTPKSKMDQDEEITKERTLGINPQLAKYFEFERDRQEAHGLKTFFVFPSGNPNRDILHGKPLGSRVLNDAFQKHIKRAGFDKQDKLVFYSLRHTFCTKLLDAPGANINDVRDRMGHTDIRTTQTYMHPKGADHHIEDALLDFASDETPQQTQ